MSRSDWWSSGAYEDLRSLDAPGFAWEYLCRNPGFTKARRTLERAAERGALDPAAADAFARRWGLRFCEPGRCQRLRPCLVVRPSLAERDRSHHAAGGTG